MTSDKVATQRVGTVGTSLADQLAYVVLNIYHLQAESPEDTLAQIRDLARTTLVKAGIHAEALETSPFQQDEGAMPLPSRIRTVTGRVLPDGWTISPDPRWHGMRASNPHPENVQKFDGPQGMSVIEEVRHYQHDEDVWRRWHHISVSRPDRLPSWRDLTFVKNAWMGKNTTAYQVLAPESAHFDYHPFCLHLWLPIDTPHLIPNFAAQNGGGV